MSIGLWGACVLLLRSELKKIKKQKRKNNLLILCITTKIKKIGYTYNPNDYVLDAVFDIERKVFYVNDRLGKSNKYDEHRLDADLSGIVDEYEIYDWDTVIEDHTLGSTRSYGWKLVFLGDDGHKYAYDGFEMGKHVFPDGYDRLSKKLIEITETIYKK